MRLFVVGLGAFALAAGCGRAGAPTALAVRVTFEPPLAPTQLSITVAGTDGAVLGPVTLPEVPQSAALSSGQTARLLVPDALAQQRAQVRVAGLAEGRLLAQGAAAAQPRLGEDVEVTVALSESFFEGGCPACDGGPPATACVGSCDALADAGSCGPCDPMVADACVGGSCQCGEHAACAVGQQCVDGECRCTEASCAGGCCEDEACVPPSAKKSKCGKD